MTDGKSSQNRLELGCDWGTMTVRKPDYRAGQRYPGNIG